MLDLKRNQEPPRYSPSKEYQLKLRYTYLDIPVSEHLDTRAMMEDRLTKGNRALSTLIYKCRDFDPQFLLFSKLYNTLVTTVIDYGAEVWGTRAVDRSVDRVQNRAIREFLGVGIHHPITA